MHVGPDAHVTWIRYWWFFWLFNFLSFWLFVVFIFCLFYLSSYRFLSLRLFVCQIFCLLDFLCFRFFVSYILSFWFFVCFTFCVPSLRPSVYTDLNAVCRKCHQARTHTEVSTGPLYVWLSSFQCMDWWWWWNTFTTYAFMIWKAHCQRGCMLQSLHCIVVFAKEFRQNWTKSDFAKNVTTGTASWWFNLPQQVWSEVLNSNICFPGYNTYEAS